MLFVILSLLIPALQAILLGSRNNIYEDDKKLVDKYHSIRKEKEQCKLSSSKCKTIKPVDKDGDSIINSGQKTMIQTSISSRIANNYNMISSFPLCPVSFLKNDNIHDLTFTYRYPNLYFFNQSSSSSSFTEENSYNCSFVNDYSGYIAPPIRCAMNYTCPIYPINIMTAMKKQQKWMTRRGGGGSMKTFDRIIQSIQEKESKVQNHHNGSSSGSGSGYPSNEALPSSSSSPSSLPLPTAVINVIVVGGSMTAGHDLNCGCICTHDVDPRCNSDLNDKCTEKPEPCTWEMHFSDWLKKQYRNINIKNFNFARGGVESSFHASFLSDWIHDNNIQLNEYDLFILDSSCNDAGLVSIIENKIGVEALIRRIQYIMAQALNQPSIQPTIIIIEQFPFPANINEYLHTFPNQKLLKHRDYANIYEDLASYYNLLLWSVRDVYWSYYDLNIEASQRYHIAPIADVNDTSSNPMHMHPHIPWFANLYMADLLAACFLQTMKNRNREIKLKSIKSSSSSSKESNKNSIDSIINNHNNENNNNYQATIIDTNYNYTFYPPPELYSHNSLSKSYCNESKPFLIRNISSTTFHPTNLTDYEFTPLVGWREYIDHHNVPGYMINKYSDPQQRSLSFEFEFNLPEDMIQADEDDRSKLNEWWREKVLKIVFLRSYENMGAVKVFICGREARKAYLDGLHSDYRQYKVSGPAFIFFTKLNNYCHPSTTTTPGNDNEYDNEYDHIHDHDRYNRGVEIHYEYPDNPSADIRKIGKFKLMSIEICST